MRVAGNEGPGYERRRTTAHPQIPVGDRSRSIVVAEVPRGDGSILKLHTAEGPEPWFGGDVKGSDEGRKQESETKARDDHDDFPQR